MPVFKLYRTYCLNNGFAHYEVEAETLEEAVQIIKDYDIDPYNSEPLFEFEQEPLKTEIVDEEGEILYDSEQL